MKDQTVNDSVAWVLVPGESEPERKSITRALSPDEAKRIFEHSLEIVCITDLNGQLLLANPAYERILGFSAEERAKEPWLDIVHPDDREKAISGLSQVGSADYVPSENPQSSDIRCRCKDGSYKWISWTGVPILAENKLFAIGRDVTQQKIAEAENRNLAAIVQSSSEAIFGIDINGTISSWNLGAERLYAYKPNEIIGRQVTTLVASECREEISRLLAAKISNETGIENLESVHVRKDGLRVEVSITISRVLDEFGKIAGFSAIVRDISHIKAVQKRISEFYSMVSHELRTPLTSIRGVLGIIEGGLIQLGTAEANDFIQIARLSCDRLVRLVNEILDTQKIESGNFELYIGEVHTDEIVDLAVAAVQGMAAEMSVAISVEKRTQLILPADKDRVIQVLINLLSNAIKFSPSGGHVRLLVKNAAPDRVRFSVSDRGPGIADEDLSKLFQKFQQLDSSDSRKKGGAGLGLAIARAIIEQHGGEIGVESQPGFGSTFWFEINGKS